MSIYRVNGVQQWRPRAGAISHREQQRLKRRRQILVERGKASWMFPYLTVDSAINAAGL